MRILALESTCDETAASVVEDGWRVLSSVIATQFDLHEKFRGVVPEIASRAHIENLLPVIQESLAVAACGLADLDAIAVAHRPGLVGSLLISVTAAKTLAWSLQKPLIGIDHVQAHLYSVMLDHEHKQIDFPAIGLVVSGGHTAIYRVDSWEQIELIGTTIDDAVGEAYDKVAAILGLAYPGGPVIDQRAQRGNPKAIQFPRTMLEKDSLNFSFSGLKTSVLYHVRGQPSGPLSRRERDRARADETNESRSEKNVAPSVASLPKGEGAKAPPTESEIDDICASFQSACIDVILKKLHRAIEQTGAKSVIVGGGVSANRGLRAALPSLNLPVHVPPMKYCTDNAAMTGGLAYVYARDQKFAGLEMDAITFSSLKKPIARRK